MNKYICVRELIFRLFRDVSLGRLCSNSLIASATTTSRNLTPAPWGEARRITPRACLHGGGGPQVGKVIRLGGVTRLSI